VAVGRSQAGSCGMSESQAPGVVVRIACVDLWPAP
jgi:hypothetical protein